MKDTVSVSPYLRGEMTHGRFRPIGGMAVEININHQPLFQQDQILSNIIWWFWAERFQRDAYQMDIEWEVLCPYNQCLSTFIRGKPSAI